jgi:hypothetical protein
VVKNAIATVEMCDNQMAAANAGAIPKRIAKELENVRRAIFGLFFRPFIV